jgi:hypothetical protein
MKNINDRLNGTITVLPFATFDLRSVEANMAQAAQEGRISEDTGAGGPALLPPQGDPNDPRTALSNATITGQSGQGIMSPTQPGTRPPLLPNVNEDFVEPPGKPVVPPPTAPSQVVQAIASELTAAQSAGIPPNKIQQRLQFLIRQGISEGLFTKEEAATIADEILALVGN